MKTFLIQIVWFGLFAMSLMANEEPKLPASKAGLESSIATATSVLVCQLTDLGWRDFGGPMEHVYSEAKFDGISAIKGQVIPKIVCSFRVAFQNKEGPPIVGTKYILIGTSKDGKLTLQKMALQLFEWDCAQAGSMLSLPQ